MFLAVIRVRLQVADRAMYLVHVVLADKDSLGVFRGDC